MATPPTLISDGQSVFNTTTTPKTVSITVQTGDRVVVMSIAESTGSGSGADGGPINTAPTGGGETYNQVATLGTSPTGGHPRAIAWTMTTTGAATFNVSCVKPMNDTAAWWGMTVWVYRNSDGFGTVGAPTVSSTSNLVTLTTAGANSALAIASSDFAAIDGASRTRRTINGSTGTEDSYFRDAAHWSAYTQHYDDTGSVGSVTGGYSAPSSQVSAIIAVEVRGTTAAASTTQILLMPARSA